jgi:hypothetical protein
VRRSLSILSVVLCGCLVPAAGHASAQKTRVSVQEKCASKLLPDNGVLLTTKLTMTNAGSGRAVTVRFRAGWNVGHLYPKAQTEVVVRLGSGQSARRTVTRSFANVPELWKTLLDEKRVNCASTKTYTIS